MPSGRLPGFSGPVPQPRPLAYGERPLSMSDGDLSASLTDAPPAHNDNGLAAVETSDGSFGGLLGRLLRDLGRLA